MPTPGTKRSKWKITKLKEHPKQHTIFGDIPDEELQALAEDMERYGQRQPIEILPDGTVVAGHQRVRAAKLLGWNEVEVVVRDDLAEKGDAAIESEFIRDNLVRRHLSPRARARCIQELMKIEAGNRSGSLGWKKVEELKRKLAAQLHLSLRSVNRYLLILQAPPAIQRAFDQGEISLINAGKTALLGKKEQQDAARRIEAGERAKAVVAEFLTAPKAGSDETDAAFQHLLHALKRDVPRLQGNVGNIPPKRLVRCRDVVEGAVSLLNEILKKRGA